MVAKEVTFYDLLDTARDSMIRLEAVTETLKGSVSPIQYDFILARISELADVIEDMFRLSSLI